MNLNNFGPKLRIKRNYESQEKEMFVEFVTMLENCWIRTNFLHEEIKVDLWSYEEDYYRIIEGLVFLNYGPTVSELILWYVYDRFDADGKLLSLEITLPGKTPKIHKLKTPVELYNLIQKINKIEK